MKKFFPIVLLFAACSTSQARLTKHNLHKTLYCDKLYHEKNISDPTNILNHKTETLELDYIVWGCACANWVTPTDFKKYQHDKLAEHCIFIEPANSELELPIYFGPQRHFIGLQDNFM
jgi:hypothetical protein